MGNQWVENWRTVALGCCMADGLQCTSCLTDLCHQILQESRHRLFTAVSPASICRSCSGRLRGSRRVAHPAGPLRRGHLIPIRCTRSLRGTPVKLNPRESQLRILGAIACYRRWVAFSATLTDSGGASGAPEEPATPHRRSREPGPDRVLRSYHVQDCVIGDQLLEPLGFASGLSLADGSSYSIR